MAKVKPMPFGFRKEQPFKIFVLDDSLTFLAFVRLHLEIEGYIVSTFESPLGITREVVRQQPDLVLVDVKMPSITGDKVCHLLRAASYGKRVVILLHSSLPKEELRGMAQRCGADGYLEKSNDLRPLIQEIDKHVREKSELLYKKEAKP